MDKFCALGLSLLLCLSGCKDSKERSIKNQSSKIDREKSWELTNLETLGMILDSTTRDQAIEILNSRGYTVILFEIGILEKVGLAELQEKSLKKWFEKELPSAELLSDGIKSLHDRLKKSSIICAINLKFEGKWDSLNLVKDPDIKKNFRIFIFDENKKLIVFLSNIQKTRKQGWL